MEPKKSSGSRISILTVTSHRLEAVTFIVCLVSIPSAFYYTHKVDLFLPISCSDNEAVEEQKSIGEFQISIFCRCAHTLTCQLFACYYCKTRLFWLLTLLCYQNITRYCKNWKLFSGNLLTCTYIGHIYYHQRDTVLVLFSFVYLLVKCC